MNRRTLITKGFTIVELLIVIVVIGILTAITTVAFNGVQRDAAEGVVQADLRSLATELEAEWLTTGAYPDDVIGIVRSEGTTFEYTTTGTDFCLTASSDGVQTPYFYDSASQIIEPGTCAGHSG